MQHQLEAGARVVCAKDEWWNAYGDRFELLFEGHRDTVTRTRTVGGQVFLELESFPQIWFWSAGFRRKLDG